MPRNDSALVQPVNPYISFLWTLKPRPADVTVAGIFGAVDEARTAVVRPDPDDSTRPALDPSCSSNAGVAFPGFRLRARHVIHAVGPVWQGGGSDEAELLARCYRSAVALAAAHGLRSLALPAISTGIYGFPPELAAPIAVGATAEALAGHPDLEAIFCCFSSASAALHEAALAAQEAGRRTG